MLLITSLAARRNKVFETATEMWATLIGTFVFLIAIKIFEDSFPVNLLMLSIFSGVVGWGIGPTIEYFGLEFKLRKYFKSRGIVVKKDQVITEEQRQEFERSFDRNLYHSEWHNVVFQALLSTALAVFVTAGVVYFTSIDFSFLNSFLFIALIILVILGLLNIFLIRSSLFSLVRAYFGAIIFVLYLLVDFARLESNAENKTWGAAVDIAVSLYLDIINLFLFILEILSKLSD